MRELKYAVRVCDSIGNKHLFAIVKERHVTKYRNLAKQAITNGVYSDDSWVTANFWTISHQWY